jgi:hypothetical protein
MNPLIAMLIAWIAAHSTMAAAGPPDIHFVPKPAMNALYFRDQGKREAFQVEGFYLPDKSTVYLPDSWRLTDLRDQSILLHELVHHLQAVNKVHMSCPQALERQAYQLQLEWLRDNGIEHPYDFAGLDVLAVIIATACPEE